MTTALKSPDRARTRCSICGTLVRPDDGSTSCPDCEQEYHEPCWAEIGGCATYGCKSAAVAEKPAAPVLVGAGWGDEKTCPSCNLTIPSSALVCRCKARFPWADPMSMAEYAAWLRSERAIASAKKTIITLFLLSIAGGPAPLTGAIAVFYAHKRRVQLGGAHGTYLAMAYGSGALGAIYLVILLLLALGL